jgi:hypothetical protein
MNQRLLFLLFMVLVKGHVNAPGSGNTKEIKFLSEARAK